jgi:hypothetical protein
MSKRSRLLLALGVLAVFVVFNCLFVERIENMYLITIQGRIVSTSSATVMRASNRTSTNETASTSENNTVHSSTSMLTTICVDFVVRRGEVVVSERHSYDEASG